MLKTLQQKYQTALESMGYHRVYDTRTSKYIVMLNTSARIKQVFLGTSGAVRIGRTATESVGASEAYRHALLDQYNKLEARRAEAKTNPTLANLGIK